MIGLILPFVGHSVSPLDLLPQLFSLGSEPALVGVPVWEIPTSMARHVAAFLTRSGTGNSFFLRAYLRAKHQGIGRACRPTCYVARSNAS